MQRRRWARIRLTCSRSHSGDAHRRSHSRPNGRSCTNAHTCANAGFGHKIFFANCAKHEVNPSLLFARLSVCVYVHSFVRRSSSSVRFRLTTITFSQEKGEPFCHENSLTCSQGETVTTTLFLCWSGDPRWDDTFIHHLAHIVYTLKNVNNPTSPHQRQDTIAMQNR